MRSLGIMGINARNHDFIMAHNPRRYYPLVDDKMNTKLLARASGIPVPELYATIEFQNQAHKIAQLIGKHKRFVIKPARGSGGSGVVVIHDVVSTGYKKASGALMTHGEMRYFINNILSGMYSLGGQSDKAIVEYEVRFDPIFKDITYQGVPDIRVIVFKGIPLMGMLRLPTRASDGKANLHTGGVGVGINMADGVTIGGVQGNHFIDNHPETGKSLTGRKIPRWNEILEIASRFYDITNLGYLGVDIVLDRQKGPMVLEANARPGLSIQVANRAGLYDRIETVQAFQADKLTSVEERVAFALSYF